MYTSSHFRREAYRSLELCYNRARYGLRGVRGRVIIEKIFSIIVIENDFIPHFPLQCCRVEDVSDDTVYSFNGEGYAVRNRVSSGPYNPYRFVISINFRTYDENALLFLAINPDNVCNVRVISWNDLYFITGRD